MNPERRVTLEDVLAAARTLAALDERGGSERALDDACALMLERAETAWRMRLARGRAHPDYGDGGIAAAADSVRRSLDLPTRPPSCAAMLRAGARVCAALATPRPGSGRLDMTVEPVEPAHGQPGGQP
jgi:hypothetical protein